MTNRWSDVSGWGLNPVASSLVHEIDGVVRARAAIEAGAWRGAIPRGLGRCYGDAAQRSGGVVVGSGGLQGLRWIDIDSGLLEAEAGVSIADLITFGEDHGWFPPVTPGTRFVTVGGALAADIHGKNHHVAGAFSAHVRSLELLTADGQLRTVGPDREPELFWATVGGLGLTGLVVSARIQMLAVPGTRIGVTTFRTSDLEATMAAMREADASHTYTVSWIDLMATGRRLGRGVVTNGDHVESVGRALGGPIATVPTSWRLNLVQTSAIRVFNEAWFRRAPKRSHESVESYGRFFYPLDGVRNWNRLYGSDGFLQYQFVCPFEHERLVESIVERIAAAQLPVFLAVLKRFGPEGLGLMSFPRPGWTLALDLPVRSLSAQTTRLLANFDDELAEVGGRVYLAKDARLARRHVAAMYPNLEAFRDVLRRIDPHQRMVSDLAERLDLAGRRNEGRVF